MIYSLLMLCFQGFKASIFVFEFFLYKLELYAGINICFLLVDSHLGNCNPFLILKHIIRHILKKKLLNLSNIVIKVVAKKKKKKQ